MKQRQVRRLDPIWCRCGRMAVYDERCEDCWAEDQARYDGKVTRRARIEIEADSRLSKGSQHDFKKFSS